MRDLFINRGDGGTPKTMINPKGPSHYLFGSGENDSVAMESGLYSRRILTDEELLAFSEVIETDPARLTLEDWQLWTQHAWKTEHGTSESAERFGEKLIEEYAETDAAMLAYLEEPTEQKRVALLSEAGDVLWCLAAGMSNSGVSAETALQSHLMQASMGILIFNNQGQPTYPKWRTTAMETAHRTLSPISLADVDNLILAGYEPQPSLVMNLEEGDEFDGDPVEAYYRWQIDTAIPYSVRSLMQQQLPSEDSGYQGSSSYNRFREDIGLNATYIFLRTAFMLRVVAGASLTDAVAINYAKIHSRIAAGLVDHSDGERPDELL
ncbi:MAG: hypothetical protein ABIP50_03490 [Candidatus Saccharimonadales bacterium]